MQLVENKDVNVIEANNFKNEDDESLKALVKVGLEMGIEMNEVIECMECIKRDSIDKNIDFDTQKIKY